MTLYLSSLNRGSGSGGAAAIINTMVNQTPEFNSVVTTGDVAPATPISGADTVRYTFDYVTDGVSSGSATTISGAYGSTISVGDANTVSTNTGIVLVPGDTYGNINYEHPNIPNWDSSGSTDSGVAQEEGVVRKVEIRTEVLQGGATVVSDETLWSSYLQQTFDNGTTDTNGAQEGSVRTPAGDVIAWTNFPDLGGVAETYTFQSNGQLPSVLGTQYSDDALGASAGYNYGAWAVANTTWTVPRNEYRKNHHGWDGTGSGNIYFDINGTRVSYPNTYSTAGNQADTEWKNFAEWAFEQIDGIPVGPLSDYIQNVEIQSFSGTYSDRLGNTAVNEYSVLYQHRFGEVGNESDPTWGGWLASCWTDAKNHLNATGTALPGSPAIGSMYVDSESGDIIEFVPRRYFR